MGEQQERVVKVSAELYPERVILRASHEFTGRAYVHLSPAGEKDFSVRFIARDSSGDLEKLEREFLTSLIDYRIRDDLESRTDFLRRRIVAQAFGEADLNGRIAAADGDPVG